ncbi:cadherin-like beta sandwich domain-containing protein [Mucilaginibacter sp. BT774]|uniref:cadherin-like beta sandwich domain-containing protein n=1 Tax=Mucilaginibacter sp. BT774 TaxID=3062276 RepID=UPI002674F9AC|nr:cadherin-like beta sandwich domain-containing protein [Mucilaginibacter sp. BT774]MDO3624657.1 cadherin-like beta sandwich domain-containing protein [Mucilaginibacter sp. BT774]
MNKPTLQAFNPLAFTIKILSVLLLLCFAQKLFAQAPDIVYGNGNNIKVTGTIPFAISPKNTGGAVPATIYGQVTTFAGSPTGVPGFVNGIGTAALFNNSQDMVKDAAGNLYVADASNNAIRMITPAGLVTTVAGNPQGIAGFADGQDTTAFFNYPDGLTIDSIGNLFVADYYNAAIRKITPSGMVTTVYRNLTETFDPQTLFFDKAGNLIFALQYGYQIVKLSPSGVLTTIAGTNSVPGATDGPGSAALFNSPTDSRMDASGNLIIADALNNEIRKIAPDGTVTTIAGKYNDAVLYANGRDTAARFNFPTGIEISQSGIIYIVDLLNNDIRKMMPDGTVSLVAGSPTQAPGNADGIFTAAQFDEPCYMRIDKTGVGYIAEWGLGGASRIRKIMLTGYTISGSLPPGLTFDQTTGIISGTATAPFTAQTDTITAYNVAGYSTAIVTLTYQPISTVATLVNLVPSAGSLDPSFVSTTTSYADSVSNATKYITLTPTVTDTTATIAVNGKPVASGAPSAQIPLVVGSNIITTVVTAQDGITTDTYTVNVIRTPSSDACLTNLAVSRGKLTPAFNSRVRTYTDKVANSVTSLSATPTVSDSAATITVNGKAVVSGTPSDQIPLAVGSNIITTVVTAQDGITKDTYTVNVTRAPSSDACLIDLAVSQGKLTPAFNSRIRTYTDTVAHSVKSITVTATVSDSTATITVDGVAVGSGTPSGVLSLAVGRNDIPVVVKAQDGVTIDTYAVVVYRGKAQEDIGCNNILTPNGDGKNDYWVIKDIELYPQNNVIVFDKRGKVVYSKRHYDNEWDGTLNGHPLAEGTYYFVVDLGPNLRKFKGSINILRN